MVRVTVSAKGLATQIEDELAADVTHAVTVGTEGIKTRARAATAAGWKGNRLPKAWRGDVYPRGQNSLEAAGFVRVKGNAADIIATGLKPTVIRAKGGNWLAIPTKEAGQFGIKRGMNGAGVTTNKRGARERITPGGFERRTGMKLRFLYDKDGGGKRAFLIADQAMLSGGKAAPYRSKGRGSKLYGPEGKSIIVFILVAQMTTRKRMDIDDIADAGAAQVAGLIVSTKGS